MQAWRECPVQSYRMWVSNKKRRPLEKVESITTRNHRVTGPTRHPVARQLLDSLQNATDTPSPGRRLMLADSAANSIHNWNQRTVVKTSHLSFHPHLTWPHLLLHLHLHLHLCRRRPVVITRANAMTDLTPRPGAACTAHTFAIGN
jgi:hypothetical protein